MHTYQIDVDKRNKPLWAMMGIASIVTAMLVGGLSSIDAHPMVKKFIPAPSAFFVFSVLYLAFDKWLWKIAPVRWFFGISEPNLTGSWDGILKSNTYNKEMPVTLKIVQRWSKISITISFDNSISSSFAAAILCAKASPVLLYNYDNIPFSRGSETMTRHIGTAELILKDEHTLIGCYFNSGDRKTEGAISVSKRIPK